MTNFYSVEGIPYPLMASRAAVEPNATVSALGIGRDRLYPSARGSE